MNRGFKRVGPLMEIGSYPVWVQDLVAEMDGLRAGVTNHRVFHDMREATIREKELRTFLVNGWQVVVQFPQYMASNLLKIRYGRSPGEDMARRYLTRNIRVEQNHADYWVDWTIASGFTRDDLLDSNGPPMTLALSQWCWKSSDHDELAASMAATNYAIEGVTGEWATYVCSTDTYENSFDPAVRKKAMRWLKLHAHYDDAHPWEALDIIATIAGADPSTRQIADIRTSIAKSYEYFKLGLDCCV